MAEKGAIERLKYLKDDIRRNKIKACDLISEEGKYNLADDIETVLNMLKEKDEETEHYKKKNKDLSKQLLMLYKEQDNYNARIEKKNEELKRKDKIIDLMARAIDNYDSQLVINIFKDKEHVKEYFERKVKE